jgi:hypothetical protein
LSTFILDYPSCKRLEGRLSSFYPSSLQRTGEFYFLFVIVAWDDLCPYKEMSPFSTGISYTCADPHVFSWRGLQGYFASEPEGDFQVQILCASLYTWNGFLRWQTSVVGLSIHSHLTPHLLPFVVVAKDNH